ncbi:hypothetical protein Cgig2_009853 [Carnegiea gigantea]|uniref:Uncharacterized protein n=1 Tax=Carnegiea gigantea TaxID=171969 RepID=A0A9Q1KLU9_9CARY|nr:hypothetical protein Cgig2_009853 [Carnegiea gigantea]
MNVTFMQSQARSTLCRKSIQRLWERKYMYYTDYTRLTCKPSDQFSSIGLRHPSKIPSVEIVNKHMGSVFDGATGHGNSMGPIDDEIQETRPREWTPLSEEGAYRYDGFSVPITSGYQVAGYLPLLVGMPPSIRHLCARRPLTRVPLFVALICAPGVYGLAHHQALFVAAPVRRPSGVSVPQQSLHLPPAASPVPGYSRL